MSKKINRKVAYKILHEYLNIKKQINKLDDDKLGILLNFVSNELVLSNKINKDSKYNNKNK